MSTKNKKYQSEGSGDDDSYQEYLKNKNQKNIHVKQNKQKRSRSRSKDRRHRHTTKDTNTHLNNHYSSKPEKSSYKKYEFGKPELERKYEENKDVLEENQIDKEKPCFEPSGILAEFTNKVNGAVLKFTEPLDAAMPDQTWRLYPFKGEEALQVVYLKGQTNFLIGKDPRVSDVIMENPTVSSQHAVIQFRSKQQFDESSGEYNTQIIPYIMDLLSTNGTILNGEKLEPQRYIELRHKDVLKFGLSTRDYVLMQVE